MKPFIKRYFSILLLSVLFIVVSFSVYFFFKSFTREPFNAFKDNTYATEILAAFLGAIVTMIITAVLLKAQSSFEEDRENRKEIFIKKIEVYSEFFNFLANVLEDNKIDSKEQTELNKWALKLSLLLNSDANLFVVRFIRQLSLFGKTRFEDLTKKEKMLFKNFQEETFEGDILDDDELENDFVTVSDLITLIRKDLGEGINENEVKSDEIGDSIALLFENK